MGMLSRRQLSATEKMAAIFGPASLLPRCSPVLSSDLRLGVTDVSAPGSMQKMSPGLIWQDLSRAPPVSLNYWLIIIVEVLLRCTVVTCQ